jgi:hypothetical protein
MAGCEITRCMPASPAVTCAASTRTASSPSATARSRRRCRARDRRGARGRDPGRPENPARAAAGIHHRRPGRHPRTDRHVRRAPRGARAHGHRCDSAAQNIVKCVQRCGLEVEDIVLEQLASSYAVLTEDEKELGVCLVDIGGGTTDIAVFSHGAIRHTAVIPIAGDQVTNDIAVSMRTPTQYAEDIKMRTPARSRSSPTRRDHRGAERRRSSAAAAGAPDARRSGRAALRRAVRPDPRRTRRSGFEEHDRRRHRADRRQRQDGRRDRTRRRSLPHAGALGCRSTWRGLVDVVRNPIIPRASACCSMQGDQARRRHRTPTLGRTVSSGDLGADEELVPGQFLFRCFASHD